MRGPVDILTDQVGSQVALAKLLGISPQAITKWVNGRIPAERVLQIERLTGVSRHLLRPDIYPLEKPRIELRAPA